MMKQQLTLTHVLRSVALLSGIASTVAAESSHSWNAFEVDFNALGGAAISTRADTYKAPSEDNIGLTATYRVTFSQAGKYDPYVRWMIRR